MLTVRVAIMSQRWHNEARLRATQHVHVELISMQTAIMDTPRGYGKCKKVDLTCTRMDANNYDKLFMLHMDMWDYRALIVWLCIVCDSI